MESGLEHRLKTFLRKRTGHRDGDRALYREFLNPYSKSNPLARTARERIMTRTQVHLEQSWVSPGH